MQGSTGSLARSLLGGGWTLNVVPATRLDAHADGLDGYQAVVLDDVAIADASPRFWSALVAAVQDRGLGLMVLGGERSFARGGYRESALESVLPVLSEPAALDQPASVVFAVDKSGSMGQGSGGVDRFQLAQRAVLETARGLGERDSLGLVVFDVVPRVLIPLGPAPAGTVALERDWQASPERRHEARDRRSRLRSASSSARAPHDACWSSSPTASSTTRRSPGCARGSIVPASRRSRWPSGRTPTSAPWNGWSARKRAWCCA